MLEVSENIINFSLVLAFATQLAVMIYGRHFSRTWNSLMLYWLIGTVLGIAVFNIALIIGPQI